eukprot:SAG22_NODE_21015_length_260_cov_1.291925_1_plen_44_part_10
MTPCRACTAAVQLLPSTTPFPHNGLHIFLDGRHEPAASVTRVAV